MHVHILFLMPTFDHLLGNNLLVNSMYPQVAHWCERAKKFHDLCNAVSQLYVHLTTIPNRPLLYDIYQYMWDAKETTMLLDSYIAWLGTYMHVLNIALQMMT